MEVTRTEDKNGAATIIVSGYTTAVAPNTMLQIRIGERVFNGGMVDGENHYQRPLPDITFSRVEVWTANKTDSVLIDSFEIPREEAEEEEKPVRKPRKKVE